MGLHWLHVLNKVCHITDYRHIPSHGNNNILSKHIYHLGYSTTTWNILIWIRKLRDFMKQNDAGGFQLLRSVFRRSFEKHSFIRKERVRGRKLVNDLICKKNSNFFFLIHVWQHRKTLHFRNFGRILQNANLFFCFILFFFLWTVSQSHLRYQVCSLAKM